jgi:hypothetical protein
MTPKAQGLIDNAAGKFQLEYGCLEGKVATKQ